MVNEKEILNFLYKFYKADNIIQDSERFSFRPVPANPPSSTAPAQQQNQKLTYKPGVKR